MPTATVGKRGTVVIPKQVRAECHLDEGTELDFSVYNNILVVTHATRKRTRMDENFDRMRESLMKKGVTLEMALETLHGIRRENG